MGSEKSTGGSLRHTRFRSYNNAFVSYYIQYEGRSVASRATLRWDNRVAISLPNPGQVRDESLGVELFGGVVFFLPAVSNAQKTGRIECARNDGYVYLYSSMATLDVRATLPCGAIVQITGRFEFYYGVISAKGDPGFVPLSTVVLLKDRPGIGSVTPDAPARERMHCDEPAAETTAPKNPGVAPFTLVKDTPIHVRLTKTLSSGTARAGDAVEREIVDDVLLEGVVVLRQGAKAHGIGPKRNPRSASVMPVR